MAIEIKKNISWVGKVDWEIRQFHGVDYSTHRGSTYNSYLVRDSKTVLIDTVWDPFGTEFVDNLKKDFDLNKIDFVVANHAEIDHSGGLIELMKLIPDVPVYCTANGIKSLKGHYHKDWNFKPVKTGDRLGIGSKELIFIEAPMLHWPDSMFCYLTKDNILFSNDAFGHHLATEMLYNDLVDQCELYEEALKYYTNILTPFSRLVAKKIEEFQKLNLPVDMICPSHGVIWRKDPLQIVKKYAEWAGDYRENQITILYDTMWNGTRRMAEAIARGIKSADPAAAVKLYNSGRADSNDIISEIFKSKAVLIGSATINNGILQSVAGILEHIRGLKFQKKKAAAFGTYGWSGEGVRVIASKLKEAGFEVIGDGILELWNPDEEALGRCFEYGKAFAGKAV